MRSRIGIAVVAFVLSGCATPYWPLSFMGGYSDMRVDEETVHVTASGNAWTSKERVAGILRLRCADVTLESGYQFFEVLSATAPTNTVERVVREATTTGRISIDGREYEETHSPALTQMETYHSAFALIRMSKGVRPLRALDAREVVKHLKRRITGD